MNRIRGVVREGKGEGKVFTQLDWVRRQFLDKLGFDPYPGTLNLQVDNFADLAEYKKRSGVEIVPGESGFCEAICFRVRVNGEFEAAWIIPQVPGYPTNQVELMAPVSVRETLGLENGDVIWLDIVEGAE